MAEKARQLLRLSVVCLFVLAAFFFACIFLLSVAHNQQVRNRIYDKVPIQQQEVATWGQIPGELQYTWTRKYKPYYLQYNPTPGAPQIDLLSTKEQTFDVKRNFEDAKWNPTKSVVGYDTAYTLTASADNDAENGASYDMINLGAYDVWYQMVNKPKYFKAWQAITQTYDLMLNSDYINRIYAKNALDFYFNNEADVKKYVLNQLTDEQAGTVYSDASYGLSTLEGLARWCALYVDVHSPTKPEDSDGAKALAAYWAKQGITIDDTQMKLIVGNGSQLHSIIAQVYYPLSKDPNLGLSSGDYLANSLGAQWGNIGVTRGPWTWLDGVDAVSSIYELNSGLPSAPEFGDFVVNPDRGNSSKDYMMATKSAGYDFNTNVLSYTTMLNLKTMQTFYEAWETHDQSLMLNRFNLTNWDQVTLFHGYLDYMIEEFMQQKGDYQVIPLSHIMYKHMNTTLKWLNETLPLDLTTRVMAGKIKDDPDTYNCEAFYTGAQITDPDPKTICENVDMSDPQTLKFYINATWYGAGNSYATQMLAQTGISAMQQINFFTIYPSYLPNNFGALLGATLTEIAEYYGCEQASECQATTPTVQYCNCTAQEIGALQWGSIGVTNNPKSTWNADYVPKVTSVYEWGKAQPSWEPMSLLKNYTEYPQITAPQQAQWTTLDWKTSQAMLTEMPSKGCLTSNFCWQQFLIPYFKADSAKKAPYETLYGFDDEQMKIFINNMRAYVQDRLFEGSFASYSMTDLLMGFSNTVAAKVNGGDYLMGDYFGLSDYTTPIINDQLGPGKSVSMGLFTGSNGVDEIGLLRMINGQSFTNKMTSIYNGTQYVDVPQKYPELSMSVQELKDVSYGIQFPPSIRDDDNLKAYDQRNIKVMTYTHSSSSEMGGNKLKMGKFTSDVHGNDIGFAYNMPVFEKPYGCYKCEYNATAFKDVKVDNVDYTQATEDSDNYIVVQPDAGQLYQMVKNSTVFMILGGNQTVDGIAYQATPLPGLDVMYGHPIPFYDFYENLEADEKAYIKKFDYIAIIGQQTFHIVIAFSILATLALVLGVVAIVVYKMKDPKRTADHGEENIVTNAVDDDSDE